MNVQNKPFMGDQGDSGMKAVAYMRVSTAAQVDKFGLEAQREMILDYAGKNGIEVVDWYVEKGESGAKEERPEFNRLIYCDVQNPPVEAVIVAKSDRVARDLYIYYAFKHELQKKGVKLISVSEDFGAMGMYAPIMEAMLMAMAEVERTTICARTTAGRKVKAYNGGYAGGTVPYGYRLVDGDMVIDEVEAEIVRAVFSMKEQGLSLRETANRLNSEGYKTRSGGDFSYGHVSSILKNRKTYEGFYSYGDNMEWVKGKHQPILGVD